LGMMPHTRQNNWKAELTVIGSYALVLYNSLKLEEPANPERSLVKLSVEGDVLKISFESKDFNALRASIMSYLKWIYVSEKILNEIA